MWLGVTSHLLLRRRSSKRSSLPDWLYLSAPESQPEGTKEADGSGLQGWESTGMSGRQVPCLSFPCPCPCVFKLRHLQSGLWEAQTCVGLRSYHSPCILPFGHCLGALTWDGGPGQIKGCWSSLCHSQVFSLLPFLAVVVVTSKPGRGYSSTWPRMLIAGAPVLGMAACLESGGGMEALSHGCVELLHCHV